MVNPAAVELQPYGWMLIVMHYKGCFGSNCTLQVCLLLPAAVTLLLCKQAAALQAASAPTHTPRAVAVLVLSGVESQHPTTWWLLRGAFQDICLY